MGTTTFTGPVVSQNGFVGDFTGGTNNLALTGTLAVTGTSTLTGAVTAPGGVTGNVTGNTAGTHTGAVAATTLSASGVTSLTNASISMTALPTSDPAVAGRLWNDGGTLKISAGA